MCALAHLDMTNNILGAKVGGLLRSCWHCKSNSLVGDWSEEEGDEEEEDYSEDDDEDDDEEEEEKYAQQ